MINFINYIIVTAVVLTGPYAVASALGFGAYLSPWLYLVTVPIALAALTLDQGVK